MVSAKVGAFVRKDRRQLLLAEDLRGGGGDDDRMGPSGDAHQPLRSIEDCGVDAVYALTGQVYMLGMRGGPRS